MAVRLEEVLEKVNFSEVSDAISQGSNSLRSYDLEDARRMIAAACEKWLVKDVERWEKVETEVERWLEVDATGLLHGFLDLEAVNRDGQIVVVDWKTSKNTFDAEWVRRLTDSWQYKIYACMSGAVEFIYRGISTPKLESGKWVCATREVKIPIPLTLLDDVKLHLESVLVMRQSLIAGRFPSWPRTMPGACFAYGRYCPFLDDCRKGSMPVGTAFERTMSYTSLETFSLCPERSRRMLLDPKEDVTDELSLGKSVHVGLSSVYRQVFSSGKGD